MIAISGRNYDFGMGALFNSFYDERMQDWAASERALHALLARRGSAVVVRPEPATAETEKKLRAHRFLLRRRTGGGALPRLRSFFCAPDALVDRAGCGGALSRRS